MTSQGKAKAALYYYKELNEELLKRYNNNTMYELSQKQDIFQSVLIIHYYRRILS